MKLLEMTINNDDDDNDDIGYMFGIETAKPLDRDKNWRVLDFGVALIFGIF